MENRKIALACFIGGSTMVGVTLACVPQYWWLGLLAGMAVGFVAYEFRVFLAAIPTAFQAAKNTLRIGLGEFGTDLGDAIVAFGRWLREPHPFVYLIPVLSAATIVPVLIAVRLNSLESDVPFWLLAFYACNAVWILFVQGLTYIGARHEKRYYVATLVVGFYSFELKALRNEGFQEAELSYYNVIRWATKGCFVTIRKVFWRAPVMAIKFICQFFIELLALIHSEQRILCALDGTLGGVLVYRMTFTPHSGLAQNLLVIVFGGLVGATFGVVHHRAWRTLERRIVQH